MRRGLSRQRHLSCQGAGGREASASWIMVEEEEEGRAGADRGAEAGEDLVARAREQGVSLTGPDGLLKQLTKTVLETALNQEMTEHLTTPTRRDTDPQLMPRDERLAAEAGSRLSGQGVTVAVRWREGPGW